MYAFRKPFSVALFTDVPGWHFVLDYKIALVLAQVLGYAVSKLIGVKVIAEITPEQAGRCHPGAHFSFLARAHPVRGHTGALECVHDVLKRPALGIDLGLGVWLHGGPSHF